MATESPTRREIALYLAIGIPCMAALVVATAVGMYSYGTMAEWEEDAAAGMAVGSGGIISILGAYLLIRTIHPFQAILFAACMAGMCVGLPVLFDWVGCEFATVCLANRTT